ncbi:hypothetical protein F4804DRAFT_256634 [Jackrogersella minutella]|nr:hypothetical protein F4804DRAFT_256634 [Jackrogersella minutella]
MYRGRSSYQGLGHGHGGPSNNWRARRLRNQGPVHDSPLGRLVTEINLSDASSSSSQVDELKISDCRYMASYSLVDSSSKIIVPGQPAAWKPPQLPSRLPEDSGVYLRDQNGAHFPKHPMQPSVESIAALNKGFVPSNVDIMGCASSLGDILRFAQSIESTFRFDVEMVGNTLFLVRNSRDQVIPDVHGFGHTFLDTFTSHEAEMRGTQSHQRIVSYSFGGLKCLVRFECDGYYTDKAGNISTATSDAGPLNLPEIPDSDSISITAAGAVASQQSILEIKTRSMRKPINMDEHLPRLWLRQIPNFIVAYHHMSGNFREMQEMSVEEDLCKWEAKHESGLRKFASVLHQVITAVKRVGHLKLELCRTGLGPLELREQFGEPREALPNSWKDMWANDRFIVYDDDDVDDSYPSLLPDEGESSESDDSEDSVVLDYTACDPACGYCGKCDY